MNLIRIRMHIDSETLHLPELRPLLGKDVEILVHEQPRLTPASEQDWEAFFTAAGTELLDQDLYREYRDFDRQHGASPEL